MDEDEIDRIVKKLEEKERQEKQKQPTQGSKFFDTKGDKVFEEKKGKKSTLKLVNKQDFSSDSKKIIYDHISSLKKGKQMPIDQMVCEAEGDEVTCETIGDVVYSTEKNINRLENVILGYEGINTVRVKTNRIEKEKDRVIL